MERGNLRNRPRNIPRHNKDAAYVLNKSRFAFPLEQALPGSLPPHEGNEQVAQVELAKYLDDNDRGGDRKFLGDFFEDLTPAAATGIIANLKNPEVRRAAEDVALESDLLEPEVAQALRHQRQQELEESRKNEIPMDDIPKVDPSTRDNRL